MAKKSATPAGELLSTLKSYFTQLSEGERTPAEVASAFNEWAREGAESIKAKIGEEVELSVSKMGFIKREEYELLVQRVEELERSQNLTARVKKAATQRAPKSAPRKAAPKKASVKKVIQKQATKKASK